MNTERKPRPFMAVARALLKEAKHRAKKKGLPFDLTLEWVVERLMPMECEASGVELSLVAYDCFCPSIDRHIPDRGYTMKNCRLVSVMFNRCAGAHHKVHVAVFAAAYVMHNKLDIMGAVKS